MSELLRFITPELILIGAACVLFLFGCSRKVAFRRAAPYLTGLALVLAGISVWARMGDYGRDALTQSVRVDALSNYIRMLTVVVAFVLLLLAWPWRDDQTGNEALDFGEDGGEFFALFLLSISGLMLTAIANDLMILFLALELVSIPTYVMVSMSRRAAVAQEAGVKYFFLGAMSVGVMLFGFSYLYGTTGQVNFDAIGASLRGSADAATGRLPAWQMLAVVLVLIGFAYKMAAFPLHFYAGDVYEGAATPVTAFLAFVPKTAGFVATVRLLEMVGGPDFAAIPPKLATLLWVLAALTMTIGNVLALLQTNVKRVLAYSSIAHSGYMLVGLAALWSGPREEALRGVLFYLAAYGFMNAGAFGVLMLLPNREGRGAAETFDDIAGTGRRNVGLGLAMAVSCFSLIGLPLTVGFWGKLMLISPALKGGMTWLVILTMVNAAISAAYYLRIVATMFLRSDAGAEFAIGGTTSAVTTSAADVEGDGARGVAGRTGLFSRSVFAGAAVVLSVAATLLLGSVPQITEGLSDRAGRAAGMARPARTTETAAAPPVTTAESGVSAPVASR